MVLFGMCAVAASTAMLGGGGVATTQPAIGVRSRAVLTFDGQHSKDDNGKGRLTGTRTGGSRSTSASTIWSRA